MKQNLTVWWTDEDGVECEASIPLEWAFNELLSLSVFGTETKRRSIIDLVRSYRNVNKTIPPIELNQEIEWEVSE